MRHVKLPLIAAAVIGMMVTPTQSVAAEAEAACVDQYLLCLNEATQEDGWLYRSAREVECGVDYYACIRRKITG
ncbi:MAG TPA: hypothetical protein VF039_13125 [Longimicrobiales bacterium]